MACIITSIRVRFTLNDVDLKEILGELLFVLVLVIIIFIIGILQNNHTQL